MSASKIKVPLSEPGLIGHINGMKGVSFQNGVEFKITIEGETWSQGDTIRGKIESKPQSAVQVFLAEGIDKKVKAKSADAFVILEEHKATATPAEWKFELALDSRISDKAGSLYVLYGNQESLEKLGQLRLNIIPNLIVRDLVDLCNSHFRFVLKGFTFPKSGETEVKLDPPATQEWHSLEQLAIFFHLEADQLNARFQFHKKEIDASKGGIATKSVKREFGRTWKIAQIVHDFNQRLNKEILTIELEKIIAEYKDAGWLTS